MLFTVLIVASVVLFAALGFAVAAFVARDDLVSQIDALRAALDARGHDIEALNETVDELLAASHAPSDGAKTIDALHARLQKLLNDDGPTAAAPLDEGGDITDEEIEALFTK